MILIIHGPNLNLLGKRDQSIYGKGTLEDLYRKIEETFPGEIFCFFQSNHEGDIIDKLQEVWRQAECKGVVINPGAYAHYSYAIADALRDLPVVAVEVHISDIRARESWRSKSVTAEACRALIAGKGFSGYIEAINLVLGY